MREDESISHDDNYYCSSCASEHEDNDQDTESEDNSETDNWQRTYSTKHILDTEKGEVVTSPRLFSAEIECITQGYDERKELSDAIPKVCGVAYDGSLTGAYGVEIQTPPIQGKKGETILVARPLSASNVMLVCLSCKKPTRVGFRLEGDTKIRYCKKCKAGT